MILSNLNSNCYILWNLRNLQEQAFRSQKVFCPFTVQTNRSSDLKKKSQSLKYLFLSGGQNNLVTKYHFFLLYNGTKYPDLSSLLMWGKLFLEVLRQQNFKKTVFGIVVKVEICLTLNQNLMAYQTDHCYVKLIYLIYFENQKENK